MNLLLALVPEEKRNTHVPFVTGVVHASVYMFYSLFVTRFIYFLTLQ